MVPLYVIRSYLGKNIKFHSNLDNNLEDILSGNIYKMK